MIRRRRKWLGLAAGTALAATAFAVAPGSDDSPDDLGADNLVFTQVEPAGGRAPDWRFPERSRIVLLDRSDPEAGLLNLTADFAAARAPDVHFDGRRIVFAGRREPAGPWQIWEVGLDGRRPRLRVPDCDRCTDPIYRPDDGIVFTAPAPEDPTRRALFTVAPDGVEASRITHHPLSDGPLGLISDGRVVMATGREDGGATRYYALRHDGTGAELLYEAPAGGTVPGRPFEAPDRGLWFVERSADGTANAVSISLAYPATSRRTHPAPKAASVRSAFPLPEGGWIATVRRHGRPVHELGTVAEDGGFEPLLTGASLHAVEAALASPRTRPLGFVSATDPGATTGTLFGIDARLTGAGAIDSTSRTLRVSTPERRLGDLPLADDGSFHLELPADRPIRFETFDGDGRRVRGPSAWIWVRPGELRGCVGCHESRSLTPPNRLPAAAAGDPVSLTGETAAEAP